MTPMSGSYKVGQEIKRRENIKNAINLTPIHGLSMIEHNVSLPKSYLRGVIDIVTPDVQVGLERHSLSDSNIEGSSKTENSRRDIASEADCQIAGTADMCSDSLNVFSNGGYPKKYGPCTASQSTALTSGDDSDILVVQMSNDENANSSVQKKKLKVGVPFNIRKSPKTKRNVKKAIRRQLKASSMVLIKRGDDCCSRPKMNDNETNEQKKYENNSINKINDILEGAEINLASLVSVSTGIRDELTSEINPEMTSGKFNIPPSSRDLRMSRSESSFNNNCLRVCRKDEHLMEVDAKKPMKSRSVHANSENVMRPQKTIIHDAIKSVMECSEKSDSQHMKLKTSTKVDPVLKLTDVSMDIARICDTVDSRSTKSDCHFLHSTNVTKYQSTSQSSHRVNESLDRPIPNNGRCRPEDGCCMTTTAARLSSSASKISYHSKTSSKFPVSSTMTTVAVADVGTSDPWVRRTSPRHGIIKKR